MLRRRPRSFCRRSLLVAAAVAWPQERSGFATGSIVGILQPSPVSCAAGCRAKRTTFASLSRARSAARSATNTPFHSADCTTANCTAMATRSPGGSECRSIRCPLRLSYGGDRDRVQLHELHNGREVRFPVLHRFSGHAAMRDRMTCGPQMAPPLTNCTAGLTAMRLRSSAVCKTAMESRPRARQNPAVMTAPFGPDRGWP